MSRTYFIKKRFHVGYSILGRQIRKRISDIHLAEGVFIIAFVALFVGLFIFNYLSWGFIQPFLTGPSAESITLFFWLGQVFSCLLFFFVCMLGFKPALRVTLEENQLLVLEQGDKIAKIPISSIRAAAQISALRFHRHYRKYQETQSFFVKMPHSLLLLSTDNNPVVIGLSVQAQEELLPLLQPQPEKIVFSSLSPIA